MQSRRGRALTAAGRLRAPLRRAGLPLLSEDFSARSDVFNRAFPLLANLAAVAGALALTLVAVALVALGYGFGLGSIVVWAGRRLTGQLARSLLLLARAIPLLLFAAGGRRLQLQCHAAAATHATTFDARAEYLALLAATPSGR